MRQSSSAKASSWKTHFSAVFLQLDGELRTHPLTTRILPSISRELVMEIAAEFNLPVREFPVLERDLPRVTEIFIASTYNDIMPVVRVGARTIGTGQPGPVTQQLYTAFAERIGAVAGVR